MKYINFKKLDTIKLTKENFYVLIDFDRTLTKGNSISGWRVLYYSDLLGEDFRKKYDEIHDKNDQKWEYRFKAYIDLLHEKNLDNQIIKEAVKRTELQLRDGAREFLTKMNAMNIPVIIISCSLKNVIKEYLEFNNCYYHNIYIYSNNYAIDGNGDNDIYQITPCNKDKIKLSRDLKDIIERKDYAFLFGDRVDDISMVTKDKLEKTITVGFLDQKIEQNLELYKSTFDIVLTENASFKEIEDIIM